MAHELHKDKRLIKSLILPGGNKMKRNLLLSWLFTLSALLIVGLTSCEGPAGSDGNDGTNGVDGVDGADGKDITSAACLTCHNDDVIIEKRAELNMHDHFLMPRALGYAGARSGCSRCHSHEGFRSFIETGTDDVPGTATPLTCESCHTLHDRDNVADFSYGVHVTDPPETLTGVSISFGDSVITNLCLQCHQPRRDLSAYDETPEDGTDNVSITSSHAGPHYSQTGSNLFGLGADDRNGTVTLNQGPMLHATGASCVSCHMGGNANHTFAPSEDNCVACHAGAEDFDINGAATKMTDALHAIEDKIVELGWYEVDDEDGSLNSLASSSTPLDLTGAEFTAFWNYNVVHADHGAIYHNPPFVKALINNIEENLGMTLTVW